MSKMRLKPEGIMLDGVLLHPKELIEMWKMEVSLRAKQEAELEAAEAELEMMSRNGQELYRLREQNKKLTQARIDDIAVVERLMEALERIATGEYHSHEAMKIAQAALQEVSDE